jgi:hypothetical protein
MSIGKSRTQWNKEDLLKCFEAARSCKSGRLYGTETRMTYSISGSKVTGYGLNDRWFHPRHGQKSDRVLILCGGPPGVFLEKDGVGFSMILDFLPRRTDFKQVFKKRDLKPNRDEAYGQFRILRNIPSNIK